MIDRFRTWIHLRPDETGAVGLLWLYSFFQCLALALFLTAAGAIFLTEFPVGQFPFLYLFTSLALLTMMTAYLRLERRVPFARALLLEALVLVASVVGLRLALGWGAGLASGLAFVLMAWHRTMGVLTNSDLARLASLLFDVRQSRRLFGLVSGAEVPANVTGYLLASALVPAVGAANLLWFSAAGLLLSFAFLSRLLSRHSAHFADDSTPAEAHPARSAYLRNPFVQWLSLATLLATVVYIFVDFAFLSQVAGRFSDQARVAAFLGLFFSVGEIASWAVKTAAYSRLLARFGLRPALLALPVALAIALVVGAVAARLSGGLLWLWVMVMFVTKTFRSAFYESAFLTLLQPLQRNLRLLGHDVISFVEAGAVGLSGLLLLSITRLARAPLAVFTVGLGALLLGWLVCLTWLYRAYLRALATALDTRVLRGTELSLADEASQRLIQDKLRSPQVGEVLYAMTLLGAADYAQLIRAVAAQLLVHPAPEVRQEALRRVETHGRDSELRAELRMLVRERMHHETLPALRQMAIRAYCALAEADAVAEVSPLLTDPNAEVRQGALVGLIRWGGNEGVAMAGPPLDQLVASALAPERIQAADVVGQVGLAQFYHPLLALLADADAGVASAALEAAGRVRNPRLFAAMVSATASSATFEPAVRALVRVGDAMLPTVTEVFANDSTPSRQLRRLAFALGRVGSEAAIAVLNTHLRHPAGEVRSQVLRALLSAGYRVPTAQRANVTEAFWKEITSAGWILRTREALASRAWSAAPASMRALEGAMAYEWDQLQDRVLCLLGLLYDPSALARVREVRHSPDRAQRANALETLDTVTGPDLRAAALALLEETTPAEHLRKLDAYAAIPAIPLPHYLRFLLEGREPPTRPWTQVAVLYAICQLKSEALYELVGTAWLRAVDGGDAVLAEMAWWVLGQIEPTAYLRYLTRRNEAALLRWIAHHQLMRETNTLLTLEKVMALKTTALFAETAEDILVDIASIVTEVPVRAGEQVFAHGEVGTCMYVIYAGAVRVHRDEFTFAQLRTRDFFGELALLDPEPRSASVTALEDGLLLRLDQSTFYEIMADRVEVTREIIKILCRRLRAQNQQLATQPASQPAHLRQ